jgi:hypothetical protein
MSCVAAHCNAWTACRECLERLLAHAATHGPIQYHAHQPSSSRGDGASAQLPLYICPFTAGPVEGPAGAAQQQDGSGYGFEVHPELGYVQVPVTADAAQVYRFVQVRPQAAL